MQQKSQRVRIVGTLVCALTLVTSIHAQTGSPGVYFPPSAWDLKIPDAARFLVLTRFEGLAVLDTETGLVWERAPSDIDRNGIVNFDDRLSWFEARQHCLSKSVGGRSGWRLPWAHELATLIGSAALFDGVTFLQILREDYWSASSPPEQDFIWGVHFGVNRAAAVGYFGSFFTWCVRGATSMDRY